MVWTKLVKVEIWLSFQNIIRVDPKRFAHGLYCSEKEFSPKCCEKERKS